MNYAKRHKIKMNRHQMKRVRRGRSNRSKGRAWKAKPKQKSTHVNKYRSDSKIDKS